MEAKPGIIVDVSHRLQKRIDHLRPSEKHYPTDDVIKEVPEGMGVKISMPRQYLHGRQISHEYTLDKELRVLKAFEEDPTGYLAREPILACLVHSGQEESVLVIIDGHHRFRESGRVQRVTAAGRKEKVYDQVPTRIFTPSEMADLLNRSGHLLHGFPYTETSLIGSLLLEVADAKQDFAIRMPSRKSPQSLAGVKTLEDLRQRFHLVEELTPLETPPSQA